MNTNAERTESTASLGERSGIFQIFREMVCRSSPPGVGSNIFEDERRNGTRNEEVEEPRDLNFRVSLLFASCFRLYGVARLDDSAVEHGQTPKATNCLFEKKKKSPPVPAGRLPLPTSSEMRSLVYVYSLDASTRQDAHIPGERRRGLKKLVCSMERLLHPTAWDIKSLVHIYLYS